MSIAVVYLTRSPENSTAEAAEFLDSYSRCDAGVEHNLYIIRKGYEAAPGSLKGLEIVSGGSGATFFDVPDDGFDINVYLEISRQIDEKYVCFFNTYSVLRTQNWLKSLYTQIRQPNVGIAGCTASYESLFTSHKSFSNAIWLSAIKGVEFEPRLYELFSVEIDQHAPNWKNDYAAMDKSNRDPLDRTQGWLKRFAALDDEFERFWRANIEKGAPLELLSNFRPFPNPHIRSNGFIIERERLLRLSPDMEYTKNSCTIFESGNDGLSARLLAKGFKLMLVDRSGAAFDQNSWWRSSTFRLGDQGGLIATDNQTRKYDNQTEAHRLRDSFFSWGKYVYPTCPFNHVSGREFERSSLAVHGHRTHGRRAEAKRPFTISIVVPTRNRLELLRDLLGTFVAQDHQQLLECIVYDNGSDTPAAEGIADLMQDNIYVYRSESFLPVTDSWNNGLKRARGDYVLVMGDDDGLVPDFYGKVARIIHDHGHVDMIHAAFFQFFHPGVAPWEPSGTFSFIQYGWFFRDRKEPFQLFWQDRRALVRNSIELRRSFSFNIQSCVFRRSFLDSLRDEEGRVFDSPFPDYYLTNFAMALASKVIVSPEPLSVAGVSRKSFGFTLFNKDEKTGEEILNTTANDPRYAELFERIILDGPAYNTNYIKTMYFIWGKIASDWLPTPDHEKYRKLQIQQLVMININNIVDFSKLDRKLRAKLSYEEKAFLTRKIADRLAFSEIEMATVSDSVTMYGPPAYVAKISVGKFDRLAEVFRYLQTASVVYPIYPAAD